jgi:hypothetical protein
MVDYFFVPENFADHLLRSTITLLVVLDPLGIVPIFIGMTQKMEVIKKRELCSSELLRKVGSKALFSTLSAGHIFPKNFSQKWVPREESAAVCYDSCQSTQIRDQKSAAQLSIFSTHPDWDASLWQHAKRNFSFPTNT